MATKPDGVVPAIETALQVLERGHPTGQLALALWEICSCAGWLEHDGLSSVGARASAAFLRLYEDYSAEAEFALHRVLSCPGCSE